MQFIHLLFCTETTNICMDLEYNTILIHTSINHLSQPILTCFYFTELHLLTIPQACMDYQNFRTYIHAPQFLMNRLKTKHSTNLNHGTLNCKIIYKLCSHAYKTSLATFTHTTRIHPQPQCTIYIAYRNTIYPHHGNHNEINV